MAAKKQATEQPTELQRLLTEADQAKDVEQLRAVVKKLIEAEIKARAWDGPIGPDE